MASSNESCSTSKICRAGVGSRMLVAASSAMPTRQPRQVKSGRWLEGSNYNDASAWRR